MNNLIKRTHLASLLITVAVIGYLPARLQAEPSPDTMNSILRTRDEAEKVAKGNTVAMVCAKCQTVLLSDVDARKGFLGWFQPKAKHECPGCGGEFSMKDIPAGQGGKFAVSEYSHTCSKCGDSSAFCCAVKAGAVPTKGMEKQ